MNIEQLKSGSYRIRQTYKGKKYSITIDHKPTQKEAIQIMAELLDNELDYKSMTFEQACKEYLKIKSNVLSPSTKRGYKGLINVFSDRFLKLNLHNVTQADIQKEINDYSVGHSPKTVANMHGFISTVMKEFRPNMQLYTKLPQKKIKNEYIPTTDEIKKVMEIIDDNYKLGYMLAICGLRRSEICALTPEDLEKDSNILHITKAWVKGDDGKWVVKDTNKTDAGTRDIILPQEFATLYRATTPDANNHVYKRYADGILAEITRCQKALKIPHFKLHSCRHYYASKLHEEHVPDAQIMAMGGWESDYVLKKIYRHALEDTHKEVMQQTADILGNIF